VRRGQVAAFVTQVDAVVPLPDAATYHPPTSSDPEHPRLTEIHETRRMRGFSVEFREWRTWSLVSVSHAQERAGP